MLKRSAVVTGAAVATHWLSPLARAADQTSGGAPKKVLFFTKSSTFQHSVITRPAKNPSQLAYAEKILTDLGAKNGFEVVCSKDGTIFSPENIKQFDVFVFCTTGDLTKDSDKFATKKNDKGKDVPDPEGKLLHKEPGMPAGAKEAFLEAIRAGKGFIGFHCAADTFHSAGHVRGEVNLLRDINEKGTDDFDPYVKMLGGEFIVHGKQQNATLKTIDPAFPGAAAFDDAKFTEEWYSLKNFAPDLHVILAQDCTGMTGPMYQRAAFPETWIRRHGEGRVFYTSMGHREDVWQKPEFIALVISALNWTSRRIDADITPNIAQATPGANVQR
jgi:type 1 glutamine amidotransferase